MYGMNTRGLPGTLAPIYQELQVERSEPPATSRTCATQLSSASARASKRLRPLSRRYPMQSATHSTCCSICEAVSRPSMRFVEIKSEAQQAAAGVHRVREMLVKQRTMLINTLRGLMAEFGIVVAEGPCHVSELVAILADPADARIPAPLHHGLMAIVETLRGLEQRIERVEKQIVGWGRANATCRHLITIPGYGPKIGRAHV